MRGNGISGVKEDGIPTFPRILAGSHFSAECREGEARILQIRFLFLVISISQAISLELLPSLIFTLLNTGFFGTDFR